LKSVIPDECFPETLPLTNVKSTSIHIFNRIVQHNAEAYYLLRFSKTQ